MNVTQSSSPGFGGSTWPCLVDGVEENDRTDIEGAAGRMARGMARGVDEEKGTLGDIVGLVFMLPKRRTPCVVVVGVVDGFMREKARANVRGFVMAWERIGSSSEERREKKPEEMEKQVKIRQRRRDGWWGFSCLICRYMGVGIGSGNSQLLPRQREQAA